MASILRDNKYIVSFLIITIVFAGLTFSNFPGPRPTMSSQTIQGTTFNYADYNSVDHEQLAIFNYLDNIVTEKPLDDWAD